MFGNIDVKKYIILVRNDKVQITHNSPRTFSTSNTRAMTNTLCYYFDRHFKSAATFDGSKSFLLSAGGSFSFDSSDELIFVPT